MNSRDFLTSDEFNNLVEPSACFKFVVVGDEIRFADSALWSHADMVMPGEKAIGAGILAIVGDQYVRILDTWSSTLKVGLTEDGENLLREKIRLPVKTRWD